jgi:phosphoribosylformimino-5-aminoimidazole carboxamide ribotide isomerase
VHLYPAIDIRNGQVVRLSQGQAHRQTVYGSDPLSVAEHFIGCGAQWIHVVDLDRAFGEGDNTPVVRRIIAGVGRRILVQLGGGLRSLDQMREALELGAARVVVGTSAAGDSAFVPAALAIAGPERLAVGIDARDGFVVVRGWTETSALAAETLVNRVVADGVVTVIYTDVARDGMLRGPDIAGAAALQRTGARVIASGGVSGLDDVRAVCQAGLAGVIVGRALYEGRLDLAAALQAARCAPSS